MSTNVRLLCGPIAAFLLLLVLFGLPVVVPGYDHLRQTVSEIGQEGSNARWLFTGALMLIAVCLLVFATGIWTAAPEGRRARVGAVLVGAMAVAIAGVGWFAHPHPLHNTFGESQLIGYLAPLAFALSRPKRNVTLISWCAFAALWTSIVINLGYLGLLGAEMRAVLHPGLEPIYGLVQRSLFFIWFGWCAAVGLLMRERTP